MGDLTQLERQLKNLEERLGQINKRKTTVEGKIKDKKAEIKAAKEAK